MKNNNDNFDDLLIITEAPLKPIAKKLKALILSIDPSACEVVRMGDRAATYGVGAKKMSEGYCYILPHKSWVNLGFYQGAHLEDPASLLEGTGKNMRHVKVKSLEMCDLPAIKTLIIDSLRERRSALSK
ncbi:DUF1801 domain-containing protein [Reinekea marina]|uniref:DUF1801 domain-containing protein n=1 Tax=Reinekea marina TaxID=1310421 RepID=A0ABV7WTD7_9GAMM|nr:DUF1801 domain-containing protein [Reinekea marina]MDN3648105.1 DUF1801 domain-containing protein [Reinekea marina]